MTMINERMMKGIAEVSEDYLAPPDATERFIASAIEQGRQTWGVTREVAVLLRTLTELNALLENVGPAEENRNKIKGLQLENGRLKKRITVLEGVEEAFKQLSKANIKAAEDIDYLEQQIRELEAGVDSGE